MDIDHILTGMQTQVDVFHDDKMCQACWPVWFAPTRPTILGLGLLCFFASGTLRDWIQILHIITYMCNLLTESITVYRYIPHSIYTVMTCHNISCESSNIYQSMFFDSSFTLSWCSEKVAAVMRRQKPISGCDRRSSAWSLCARPEVGVSFLLARRYQYNGI